MAIIQQEVSAERWIDIPDPVRDVYRMWRPTPLFRADRLERALDTPARIFYKYEGVSPAGSHKPNTAVPQAYYNASTLCTMPTRDVPELQRDHHRGDDRVLHLNADCRWRSEASCHST
jgi:predicted alternative tryptophan synthase beta-subunit